MSLTVGQSSGFRVYGLGFRVCEVRRASEEGLEEPSEMEVSVEIDSEKVLVALPRKP